jgi:predicted Ser/Thr protein kinase
MDWKDAESRLGFEPEDQLTPETLYDAQWALLLLRRATKRLEQEQAATGKAETFQTLKCFLGGDGGGRAQLTYEQAAHALPWACLPSLRSSTGYAGGTRSWCARKWNAPCWTRQRSRPSCMGFARRWCEPKEGCIPSLGHSRSEPLSRPASMKFDAPLEPVESQRPRRCAACGTPYLSNEDDMGCPVCALRRAMPPESIVEIGPGESRFDHYELMRRDDGTFAELGRGAMGVTYRAVDTVLGHEVALKVIDARLASRPGARARFLREARAAARLRDPHVASVFYYGMRPSDGQCFYAMELVEGETLEARVRGAGPLSAPESLEIVAQVTRALAAADVQGIVHRDLKPANLMLVSGPELNVKIIDFGLAKAAEATDEAELTHGGFVGTPAFASPEQCAGAGVDVRSDLYALGITLWVMLTGRAPFLGSPTEVLHQHRHTPLPLERLQEPQPANDALAVTAREKPGAAFPDPGPTLAGSA